MTEMHPVKSSNVEAIGHDGKDLHINYRGGTQFIYHDVDRDIFERALKSESLGRFLFDEVKGKFSFTKR